MDKEANDLLKFLKTANDKAWKNLQRGAAAYWELRRRGEGTMPGIDSEQAELYEAIANGGIDQKEALARQAELIMKNEFRRANPN